MSTFFQMESACSPSSQQPIDPQASASSDPDSESTGDFASEQIDWRDFRARLVAQQASAEENVAQADDIWRTRASKENQELLERQNPVLAKELPWAHPTGGPEIGGLVLAAHVSFPDETGPHTTIKGL